jgi:hypothetical protein
MRSSPAGMYRGGRVPQSLMPASGCVVGLLASALVLTGASAARSGPCAEQIAQLERQVANIVPGPQSGPTGPQEIGAQLHRQPTPGSVAQAERVANTDADDALARAKKADAEGNAAECNAAVRRAQELYGIQ